MKKTFFLLFLLPLAFVSCKKDEATPVPINTTPAEYNGLGNRPGNPTGTAISLPSNLQIIGSITGGLVYNKASRPEKVKGQHFLFNGKAVQGDYIAYGTGTYVDLYMKIISKSGVDTTWIIPGGTVFIDSSGTYQNGLILQDDSVFISGNDTAFVNLKAYCTNLSRHGSDEFAIYRLGVITNNPAISEVVAIMRNKLKPYGNESAIQDIIWNITEYSAGLSAEDRSVLQQLP